MVGQEHPGIAGVTVDPDNAQVLVILLDEGDDEFGGDVMHEIREPVKVFRVVKTDLVCAPASALAADGTGSLRHRTPPRPSIASIPNFSTRLRASARRCGDHGGRPARGAARAVTGAGERLSAAAVRRRAGWGMPRSDDGHLAFAHRTPISGTSYHTLQHTCT